MFVQILRIRRHILKSPMEITFIIVFFFGYLRVSVRVYLKHFTNDELKTHETPNQAYTPDKKHYIFTQ